LDPKHIAQARRFYERAFTADPDNVDALVGSARMDAADGSSSFVTDPMAAFAAAHAKLTKALSPVRDHAHGHMVLGIIYLLTRRAAQGIAECEHALGLDQNLAHAKSIGLGKIFVGRAEETEAHVYGALRLSPRDMMAYTPGCHTGALQGSSSAGTSRLSRGFAARSTANHNHPLPNFGLAATLAPLGLLDEARTAVKAGLALHPNFSISHARASFEDHDWIMNDLLVARQGRANPSG
jgi:tetratricopeptide (TPR) repeat protein